MTGEYMNEGTPEDVTSIASRPPGNLHVQSKATSSMTVNTTNRHVAFFYSHNMLTANLRADIDKKWEACWPINEIRPLVLLDLTSYLLFLKEIEEKQLLPVKLTDASSPDIFVRSKERDELSWSRFKDLDPHDMHTLFIKEKGIPDLIKNYSRTNLRYSLFLKEPLLLVPTPGLLSNIVDIIKIMETQDSSTSAAIFEYLLHKSEVTAQNGQVYAPGYVVKLMVALTQPTPEDIIGDPSAGNGSLLVNSALYIMNKYSSIPNFKNDFTGHIYKGIESDLIQLRIGAMNMILHGIEDPKLDVLNVLSRANLSIRQQPSLILSNLFFEGHENKISATAETPQTDTRRQEILFLNLILKSLKHGGRAAVIIREILLYDNITEIKSIRQKIIDDFKLEAVISLPTTAGSLFSGACILTFSNHGATNTTDKVWLYKMEAGKEVINKRDENLLREGSA